jgi:hypothetical protein
MRVVVQSLIAVAVVVVRQIAQQPILVEAAVQGQPARN